MIGYSTTQKTYKLWGDTLRKVVILRDVVFDVTCRKTVQCKTSLDEQSTRQVFAEPTLSHGAADHQMIDDYENLSEIGPAQFTSTSEQDLFITVQPTVSEIEISSSSDENYVDQQANEKSPSEWWKGDSVFIADILDKNLTFDLATKGVNRVQ